MKAKTKIYDVNHPMHGVYETCLWIAFVVIYVAACQVFDRYIWETEMGLSALKQSQSHPVSSGGQFNGQGATASVKK